MLWTNRGKFLLFDWVFGGEPLPDNFYVMLITADNVPTADTNTLSELTEIADGNGYTEGGYELTPGTPDFDVIIEDDVNNLARIQIKDILWTATGGTIPASGNGARYVVLTDDSESSSAALGDRQIIAVWDMVTDRVAIDGFPISLTNLELRTVGLGGAVSTDSITEGEDAAPVPAGPVYGGFTGYESPLDDDAVDDDSLPTNYSAINILNYDYGYGPYGIEKAYQAFVAEATYTLKITRVVLMRYGYGPTPSLTAKLYAADAEDKPTGAVLMSTTLEGWDIDDYEGINVGHFIDINWKDGSPKDYEVQEGTKYVIELTTGLLEYYADPADFPENFMSWQSVRGLTEYPGISQSLWFSQTTPDGKWYDTLDGEICLFRNFGE